MSRHPAQAAALLAALMLAGSALAGNPPAIEWQRHYAGLEASTGNWVEPTSDGGYALVGMTLSSGDSSIALYLVKTDSLGQQEWERRYTGGHNYAGHCVQTTPDGGYVLLGSASRPYADTPWTDQPYLVKTDSAGHILWHRVYIADTLESGYCVLPVSDGGFVLTCMNPAKDSGLFLVRTDSLGEIAWRRTYAVPYGLPPRFIPVIPSSTGGYVVGTKGLLKTDSAGAQVWLRTYLQIREVSDVTELPTGGYVGAGSGYYGEPSHYDSTCAVLFRTDSQGNLLWVQDVGNRRSYGATSVTRAPDGGFIVAAQGVPSYGFLARTDSSGAVLWSKDLKDLPGFNRGIVASQVRYAPDGTVLVVGTCDNPAVAAQVMCLWKLQPETN